MMMVLIVDYYHLHPLQDLMAYVKWLFFSLLFFFHPSSTLCFHQTPHLDWSQVSLFSGCTSNRPSTRCCNPRTFLILSCHLPYFSSHIECEIANVAKDSEMFCWRLLSKSSLDWSFVHHYSDWISI